MKQRDVFRPGPCRRRYQDQADEPTKLTRRRQRFKSTRSISLIHLLSHAERLQSLLGTLEVEGLSEVFLAGELSLVFLSDVSCHRLRRQILEVLEAAVSFSAFSAAFLPFPA